MSHDYTNDVNGRASKQRRWQCGSRESLVPVLALPSREALVLVLNPESREALVLVLNLSGIVR